MLCEQSVSEGPIFWLSGFVELHPGETHGNPSFLHLLHRQDLCQFGSISMTSGGDLPMPVLALCRSDNR
jgi:hypothetical protein